MKRNLLGVLCMVPLPVSAALAYHYDPKTTLAVLAIAAWALVITGSAIASGYFFGKKDEQ